MIKQGTWWWKARRALESARDTPAYIHYWAADDAFEKASVFRRVRGGGPKADHYHRIGVKEYRLGEAAEKCAR